jgi:ribulose-5-phosphate 4-epimerase/fuculose-1-phosphate aldolase
VSTELELAVREVVLANRILAHENIVEASGHVSARHPHYPDRYLISWSRSPELVTIDDIMECTLAGDPIGDDRPPYRERHIHGAIYEARPDVRAIVHTHAEEVLPFGIVDVPLRPVIGSASMIGARIPVWDIADDFGHDTSLLVETLEQGRSLARCLGRETVALMAAHGMAAAAGSMIEVVRVAVYLARNARVQLAAMQTGKPLRYLSDGEITTRATGAYFAPNSHGIYRAWEYWALRAGCADLLPPRDADTLRTH